VVTAITARSGTTLGSGTARILNSSTSTLAEITGEPTETKTVKNLTDKQIAVDSYVMIDDDKNGDWWAILPGSCSNLS
jgi:hypothetical protein